MIRLPRSRGRGLRGFMRRTSLRILRISGASRCSIPSSEPRATLFIACPRGRPPGPVDFSPLRSTVLLHQHDLFDIVDFLEAHFDDFMGGGLHLSPYVVGLHRDLAVAAIDQYTELQQSRPAMPEQRVHGGPRGAASVQNVVYQNDRLARNRNANPSFLHDRLRPEG